METKQPRHFREQLKPKTKNHVEYIRSISENDVTFCIGPAGSSKSYTSIGLGCQYLLEDRYEKLIIARPAVEACGGGRGLGYLSGSLEDKLSPFLLPAIEYLKKFLSKDTYSKMYHEGRIEFKALEYCRGITLDDSFIIGEEFQSCTTEQIKMFVSRIGHGSKMVISGDLDQSDINRSNSKYSTDLEFIIERVEDACLEGFGIVRLNDLDIMRNPIIGPFLKAIG